MPEDRKKGDWVGTIATAAALLGSAAFVANQLRDGNSGLVFPASGVHRDITDDDSSPPDYLKRQILSGATTAGYFSGGSSSTEQNPTYTINDLEGLAKRYKDESKRATDDGNFTRLHWLCKTQEILHSIIDMRRKLDIAQKAGDFSCLSSLTYQVQKLQQQLGQRLQQEAIANEEKVATKNHGDEAESVMLSPTEVEGLIRTLDKRMGDVDYCFDDSRGLANWRKMHAKREHLVNIQATFDKIKKATEEDNEKALEQLSEQLESQQASILSDREEAKAPKEGQRSSLFQKIRETLGLGSNRSPESRQDVANSKGDSLPSAKLSRISKGKRSREEIVSDEDSMDLDKAGYGMKLRSRSMPQRKKAAKRSNHTAREVDEQSNALEEPSSNIDDSQSVSLIGDDANAPEFDKDDEDMTPSLSTPEFQFHMKDSIDHLQPESDNFQDLGTANVQENNSKALRQKSNQSRTPPVLATDPTWPEGTILSKGKYVNDIDDRLFYITQVNENLRQVAENVSAKLGDNKTPDEILQDMIDANSPRYTKRSMQLKADLVPGIPLVIPPHKWPTEKSE